MDWRANEKTHWGDVDRDDGWTISLADFLPSGSEFPCSTMLDLGEMFTQFGFPLPRAETNEGSGTNRRPLGLPFAPNFLRLLSLHGVSCFHLAKSDSYSAFHSSWASPGTTSVDASETGWGSEVVVGSEMVEIAPAGVPASSEPAVGIEPMLEKELSRAACSVG